METKLTKKTKNRCSDREFHKVDIEGVVNPGLNEHKTSTNPRHNAMDFHAFPLFAHINQSRWLSHSELRSHSATSQCQRTLSTFL
jgi:hypothetical protein